MENEHEEVIEFMATCTFIVRVKVRDERESGYTDERIMRETIESWAQDIDDPEVRFLSCDSISKLS